ncbi:DUF397 domain-containing protein [Streptomyces sp. NPDC006670]|uniref:DUF397 domain-containing protein n=1 Tax=Streptomyces sp. NPDC006670 TaxID=3154476 RepID=UPI0033F13D82
MSTTSGTGLPTSVWTKSSYSGEGGGTCVEACAQPQELREVHVRDSKRKAEPGHPVIRFGAAAWSTFTAGLAGS